MNVSKILETKGGGVVTITAEATIRDAVTLLNTHNIGALVVVDDGGAISGILSERDIVRKLLDISPGILAKQVSGLMTKKPVTCTRDDSVDDVMQMMTGRHFRHMPVVDGGVLVGLISIGDVVKTKIEATEGEAAALREYIAS